MPVLKENRKRQGITAGRQRVNLKKAEGTAGPLLAGPLAAAVLGLLLAGPLVPPLPALPLRRVHTLAVSSRNYGPVKQPRPQRLVPISMLALPPLLFLLRRWRCCCCCRSCGACSRRWLGGRLLPHLRCRLLPTVAAALLLVVVAAGGLVLQHAIHTRRPGRLAGSASDPAKLHAAVPPNEAPCIAAPPHPPSCPACAASPSSPSSLSSLSCAASPCAPCTSQAELDVSVTRGWDSRRR